ncbi:hypothetical protein THRCLA_11056 [Thraustotheca clavata]|uniref:Ubiquitin-like domain-containing protein n=1 Tax=Thraustotheca clavata TaxID=74557 RepID=A0A1V9Y904_9STRA|nr:hypothetical protein THRCLA_11056 [Thraustotheca clavata]
MPAKQIKVISKDASLVYMTVYVSMCQQNKSDKFTTKVTRLATVEAIQRFLMEQWQITKNPLMNYPLSDHIFSFNGRIMRHEANLDIYYLNDNDTIYIRFPSLGPLTTPWGMTSSELREALQARNVYRPNLLPEQLMYQLHRHLQKESRLERLQRATKRGLVDEVHQITQELRVLEKDEAAQLEIISPRQLARPKSISWPIPPCPNRTIFHSISELELKYEKIPRDVLEPAIFIFGANREWVFAKHNKLQKASFDYKYMAYEKDFLDMLVFKEEASLVFWFEPERSLDALSSFLCQIRDPVTSQHYRPLLLEAPRWLSLGGHNGWEGKTRRDGRRVLSKMKPIYTTSVQRIVTNLQSNSFDIIAIQEMIKQANPTLLI